MLNFATVPLCWKMWKNANYKRLSSKTLAIWLFKCLIAAGSNGATVVLELVRKLKNISQQFQKTY